MRSLRVLRAGAGYVVRGCPGFVAANTGLAPLLGYASAAFGMCSPKAGDDAASPLRIREMPTQ